MGAFGWIWWQNGKWNSDLRFMLLAARIISFWYLWAKRKKLKIFFIPPFCFCCFPIFSEKLFLFSSVCSAGLFALRFDAITRWCLRLPRSLRHPTTTHTSHLRLKSENQEEEYFHVKCPSTQNIHQLFRSRTRLFIFLYFTSSLSRSLRNQKNLWQKLLMSLFENEQFFHGFAEKRGAKFEDLQRPFSAFIVCVKENKFARGNDKFYFDRWSESFIMIRCFSAPTLLNL